jgi:hypothetical protein
MSSKTRIIVVPIGTRIQYEFPGVDGLVTLVGVKSHAIHTDDESVALAMQLGNQGYYIITDAGEEVPISRYAMVEVL